jgi:hypothetical protein
MKIGSAEAGSGRSPERNAHYCDKQCREIPARHDSQFEYRFEGPSSQYEYSCESEFNRLYPAHWQRGGRKNNRCACLESHQQERSH